MKIILTALIALTLASCNEPKCYDYKKVLDVEPFHATRVEVTYISKCGDTIRTTEHFSAVIKADNMTLNVQDYINGKIEYGKIK